MELGVLDGVMEDVTDGVCDGVCDGVWLFGKDSFEECPLTFMQVNNSIWIYYLPNVYIIVVWKIYGQFSQL